jgi:hypothetical protein
MDDMFLRTVTGASVETATSSVKTPGAASMSVASSSAGFRPQATGLL